jgi:hypothetical protein
VSLWVSRSPAVSGRRRRRWYSSLNSSERNCVPRIGHRILQWMPQVSKILLARQLRSGPFTNIWLPACKSTSDFEIAVEAQAARNVLLVATLHTQRAHDTHKLHHPYVVHRLGGVGQLGGLHNTLKLPNSHYQLCALLKDQDTSGRGPQHKINHALSGDLALHTRQLHTRVLLPA